MNLVPLHPGWRESAKIDHPLVSDAHCAQAHALVTALAHLLDRNPDVTPANACTLAAIITARRLAAGSQN